MKSTLKSWILLISLLAWTPALAETLQIKQVEFIALTNVKMFKFTGMAKDLSAQLERNGTQISALEIRIPVSELKTGMEIRDKHMRERVFTAADGTLPDVVLKVHKSDCRAGASASEQTCLVSGKLAFRGVERPYEFSLNLKDGKKIEGAATVDVTGFGVTQEALSYTHIRVIQDVQIKFEAVLP